MRALPLLRFEGLRAVETASGSGPARLHRRDFSYVGMLMATDEMIVEFAATEGFVAITLL